MSAISGAAFQKAVIEEGRLALVEFWAPWCTHCRRLGPAMEQVEAQYGGKLLVGQVNTDEEPELARQFGIEVIPTLVFFRGGSPQETVSAPASKAGIDRFLAQCGV